MLDEAVIATSTIAWIAFVLGGIFGYVGNKTHFCTMGAVSDIVNIGDWTRMRMWAGAIGVAVLGTTALQMAGLFDAADSIYTSSRLNWLSHLLGGALFGVGMTLASGCGSKTLMRIGTGNLKSLIVFVFLGISAYMTLRGLFGVWRIDYIDVVAIELGARQDVPSLLSRFGFAPEWTLPLTGAVAGGGLLLFMLSSRGAWQLDVFLAAIVIGALIVAGWVLTGHIGYVEEHPHTLEAAFIGTNSGSAESFSFVAPIAYTLELFMMWSDTSRIFTFGIAGALGLIAGAGLHAALSRTFRIESFRDPSDLLRHIAGGMLMGFGGITALGCTIGQAIAGVSTLAIGSMITALAIIAGAAVTMKIQFWLLMRST